MASFRFLLTKSTVYKYSSWCWLLYVLNNDVDSRRANCQRGVTCESGGTMHFKASLCKHVVNLCRKVRCLGIQKPAETTILPFSKARDRHSIRLVCCSLVMVLGSNLVSSPRILACNTKFVERISSASFSTITRSASNFAARSFAGLLPFRQLRHVQLQKKRLYPIWQPLQIQSPVQRLARLRRVFWPMTSGHSFLSSRKQLPQLHRVAPLPSRGAVL